MTWTIKENTDGTRQPEWVEDEPVMEVKQMVEYNPNDYREFHKIDMTTGERLDVLLFDVNNEEVPEDCKEGWTVSLHNPKWDFLTNNWMEGNSFNDIIAPLKLSKIDALNEECQRLIESGFIHNEDQFQFNQLDQANFNQQLSLLLLDPELDSVMWKTENNGIKVFNRQQFIEACKAGEFHKRNSIGKYWQLKEYILTHNFDDLESLQAIDLNYII